MSDRINVLVVDDHVVVREGIKMVLTTDPELKVVGEASSGEEAVDRVKELKPHVVVMDISMPGLDGIEGVIRGCTSPPLHKHRRARGWSRERYAAWLAESLTALLL